MDPCCVSFDLQFAIAAQTNASSAFLTGPRITYLLMYYDAEGTVVAMRNEGA